MPVLDSSNEQESIKSENTKPLPGKSGAAFVGAVTELFIFLETPSSPVDEEIKATPLAVTPLAVTPLAVTPLAVTPLAVTPLAVTPEINKTTTLSMLLDSYESKELKSISPVIPIKKLSNNSSETNAFRLPDSSENKALTFRSLLTSREKLSDNLSEPTAFTFSGSAAKIYTPFLVIVGRKKKSSCKN